MKLVPLGKAKNELSAYVERAQATPILITRHGRAAALLIGVEGEELEDLLTQADPQFWRMLEHRRRTSKTVSSTEARRRLGLPRRG